MSTPLRPLKFYRELATRKGRLESGLFLVEGDRAIRQVLSNHPGAIVEILAAEEPSPVYSDFPMRLITESQLRSISLTRTPQGIMAVVRFPLDIYSGLLPGDRGNKILLLEDIQDPGNIGTLIRTAGAFGFSGIILTENCADPLSPKCVQASAGTILEVWLRRTGNYLELAGELRRDGYCLVAAELNGVSEPSILNRQKRLLLALGNEGSGLSEGLLSVADYHLRVPTLPGKAESLNVAACGAILMYLSWQGG